VNEAEFFAAIQSGNLAEVARLAAAEAALLDSRNERGVSAVLAACYSGRQEVRDFLIAEGASLELAEAAASGRLPRVKELVEAEPAAARGSSPDGFPVMALAAAFGHLEVVRYLLDKGAEVNAVASNGSGYTALTGAVAGGHLEIARFLAEHGAHVNYRYARGYSPLLTAAANGHLEIVKMLVANRADLEARSDDGKTALDFARERKHEAVASYLRGQGLSS